MAMTIMHNTGSMLALGQTKKNDTNLSKQLKKVSSGMRINSAGDDAAGYSISEKMRTMIRSLGQDIQNAQTGNNLVAVAEGGIQEIVNNLRSMKQLAINSANDHNTDSDRQIIEKEFASRKQTIHEIAATTNYNGRLLLTGTYAEWQKDYSKKAPTSLINDFQPAFSTCSSNYVPNTTVSGGGNVLVDNSYVGSGSGTWNYWSATGQTNPTSGQRSQIAVAMDFSALASVIPGGVDGKGFSILCGACDQYINITFDASTATSSYTSTVTPPPGEPANPSARAFTIGIQNVTSAAGLAKAVFDGISSLQNQVSPTGTGNTATNVRIDSQHDLRLAEINGSYYFLKDDDQCEMQFLDGLYGGPKNEFSEIPDILGTPLIIHTGTKGNQNLKLFINGMYPKNMELDNVHVTTRQDAVAAMGALDKAVDYALDEITRMGAYRMRLEQTEGNLVIGEENTQAAESTLRDADMAKEMTGYTKANILTQAAQAMLAQANQSSGSVLNLIQ
jgi:flagellin